MRVLSCGVDTEKSCHGFDMYVKWPSYLGNNFDQNYNNENTFTPRLIGYTPRHLLCKYENLYLYNNLHTNIYNLFAIAPNKK